MDMKIALAQLDAAAAGGKLSPGAAANIRTWLSEPYLAEYAPQVAGHLAAGQWQQLEEAFWTTIPFGTGGRRGKMYPIGSTPSTIAPSARAPRAGRLRRRTRSAASRCPAPSPTIPGTARGSLPSYRPRSWRPPATRSSSSTAIGARRNCRSPSAIRSAIAASSSPPAITRRPTTPSRSTGPRAANFCRRTTRSASTTSGRSLGSSGSRSRRGCGRARSSIARKKLTQPSSARWSGKACRARGN